MRQTKIRGLYKQKIKSMLYKSDNLLNLLIGDCSELSNAEKIKKFNENVKSHLFIDDTLTEKETLIFFDVVNRSTNSQTKDLRIVLYAICHRDLLDEPHKLQDYYGNRADVLSELIEETLLNKDNANQFGIGKLKLDTVDIYNSETYYGTEMIFSATDFR